MNDILITLFNEDGEEVTYKIERIFSVDGSGNMYCAVAPATGGDIIFLECILDEDGEKTALSVADIADMSEYRRVAEFYKNAATKAAVEQVCEELREYDDFISLTGADGKMVDFIVHTIFEDEGSGRSYIAMQRVDDAGEVSDEISLYRFIEGEENTIDMISSDMEYERVRNLFMELLTD